MADSDPQGADDLRNQLQSVRSRLRGLTVAVMVMALMLTITVAAVFGSLVNWFAYDGLLYGGATACAALLGFAVGWIARRRA